MAASPGLGHYSNDSWLFYPNWALSDPGENVIADQQVGSLLHTESPDAGYVWKEFQVNYNGWANDLADGYISLMITGGQYGVAGITQGNIGYTWGVDKEPELTLTITSVPQPITITLPNGGESFQAGTSQEKPDSC